jgi:hypothetical protein
MALSAESVTALEAGYSHVVKQRDELLAALRDLMEALDEGLAWAGDARVKRAEALIAALGAAS